MTIASCVLRAIMQQHFSPAHLSFDKLVVREERGETCKGGRDNGVCTVEQRYSGIYTCETHCAEVEQFSSSSTLFLRRSMEYCKRSFYSVFVRATDPAVYWKKKIYIYIYIYAVKNAVIPIRRGIKSSNPALPSSSSSSSRCIEIRSRLRDSFFGKVSRVFLRSWRGETPLDLALALPSSSRWDERDEGGQVSARKIEKFIDCELFICELRYV